MKVPCDGIRPAYNLQLASDPSSGAIVGVDVVSSPADSQQSGPLHEQVEHRTERKVKEHLMDEGYVATGQIDAAKEIYRQRAPAATASAATASRIKGSRRARPGTPGDTKQAI